jgi:hypothetical protein
VLEILRRLKVFQPPACPFSPEIQILFRRSKKPPVFASLKQKTVRLENKKENLPETDLAETLPETLVAKNYTKVAEQHNICFTKNIQF